MSKKRDKNARKKQLRSRLLSRSNARTVKHNDVLGSLDYSITHKPIDNDDVRKLPNEVQDKIEDLYKRVQVTPHDTIDELEMLIKNYPDIPQLYNYLYAAYAHTGQEHKANTIMKDSYERNPSYLFAKLNYSDYLVKQGELDKVAEIYDSKFDLSMLYPNRDTFHASEVISFNGVIGYYHAMVGQYHDAMRCLNILKALSTTHWYTLRLEQKLESYGKFVA
jgi:tetratricopeptide (TPR) repeat protein